MDGVRACLRQLGYVVANLDVRVDGEVLLGALGEVVDAGVLDDRGEHEEEAHEQEDVERGGVGDFGDAGSSGQTQRARRQQRRYTCQYAHSSPTNDLYSTVALVPPMSTMDVWRGIT